MPNEADQLIAEARALQTELNLTLDNLAALGVVCHSVVSYQGYAAEQRFAPMPVHRVALVLEMKAQE